MGEYLRRKAPGSRKRQHSRIVRIFVPGCIIMGNGRNRLIPRKLVKASFKIGKPPLSRWSLTVDRGLPGRCFPRDDLASQLLDDNEDRVVAHAHARYACACPLAGGYRRHCPGNQIKYRCARVRMLKWEAERSLPGCDRFPRIMVTEPHRCHRSARRICSLEHIMLKISRIEIGIRLGNAHNWPD